MKRTDGQDVQGVQRQRLSRVAMRRTLRDLRRSVAARRPITLPNLLRLLRRRMTAATPSQINRQAAHLRRLYLKHQPFTGRSPD